MKPNRFKLTIKDTLQAILLMLIANALMIIMSAAENKFPTIGEFKIGLINSVKYAVIPYLLKKFFTDDVKNAKSILKDEQIKNINSKIKDNEKIS